MNGPTSQDPGPELSAMERGFRYARKIFCQQCGYLTAVEYDLAGLRAVWPAEGLEHQEVWLRQCRLVCGECQGLDTLLMDEPTKLEHIRNYCRAKGFEVF